jgi:17beta-estradiol 17-dehydrogenase / very-long-chain 3-oxoacyl-CoA reductase
MNLYGSLTNIVAFNVFQYVGLFLLSYKLLKLTYRILNNIGTFFFGMGTLNLKNYGSWAVVTGCTDGMGKAFSENLAEKGLNLVLISRTLEKLQKQAVFIEERYKVKCKIIVADFTGKYKKIHFLSSNLQALIFGLEMG